MLSVLQTDILLNEIMRRVIFSAFTSALWLLIALAVLWLLRVRNPAVRHVFYVLALAKGFVSLVREQPPVVQNRGPVIIGLQFPNPSILPDMPSEIGASFFRTTSTIAFGPGVVVLAATVTFLLWRFLAFLRFQRTISNAAEIDRHQTNTTFFATLDRLVEQAHVAYPKIILVNSSDAPFTVGFKRPVIAFSPVLLKELTADEFEAVLAHEVAHIARRDHLYHWPILLMRDVLFFGPLTHDIYRRLSFERERACDDFSSKVCGPLALAKSLVRVAEIKAASPAVSLVKSFAPQSFLSKRESHFSRRVTELIEPKPYVPLSWPRRIFLWFGAFLFLYAEIHVVAFQIMLA